jgi:hypothetical protein
MPFEKKHTFDVGNGTKDIKLKVSFVSLVFFGLLSVLSSLSYCALCRHDVILSLVSCLCMFALLSFDFLFCLLCLVFVSLVSCLSVFVSLHLVGTSWLCIVFDFVFYPLSLCLWSLSFVVVPVLGCRRCGRRGGRRAQEKGSHPC